MINLLQFYSTWYKKVIILGDFDIEDENKLIKDFLCKHTSYNMMKQNTPFKGDGGLRIDLLITSSKLSFMKTNSFETGSSDHHHMIYSKQNLKSLNQRNQYTAISNNMIVTK